MNRLNNRIGSVNRRGLFCLTHGAQLMTALVVVLAMPSFGQAAVFNVRKAGNVVRLIRVIERANANNQADTINLAAGIYILNKVQNTRQGANGLPVIRTKITINGAVFTGDGRTRTTIERQDGVDEFRIFQVTGTGNLTLNRIRIQGGEISDQMQGSGVNAQGGGVSNGGSLRLLNAIVSDNSADATDPTGSGIFNAGTAILIDSTVRDNDTSASQGGGILNGGTLRLIRSTISRNSSSNETGPGIINFGTLRAVNTTISGNFSQSPVAPAQDVGGIWNLSDSNLLNPPTRTADLRFVTITEHDGIGISNKDGRVIMSNSVLAGNGVGRVEDPENPGQFINITDCAGTLNSRGFNLLGNKADCDFNRTRRDQVGGTNQNPNPINRRLRALAFNGGPTQTHALRLNSPAIDRGNNAVCPDTDQRGFRRPVDGNGDSRRICDIGAFERGAVRR